MRSYVQAFSILVFFAVSSYGQGADIGGIVGHLGSDSEGTCSDGGKEFGWDYVVSVKSAQGCSVTRSTEAKFSEYASAGGPFVRVAGKPRLEAGQIAVDVGAVTTVTLGHDAKFKPIGCSDAYRTKVWKPSSRTPRVGESTVDWITAWGERTFTLARRHQTRPPSVMGAARPAASALYGRLWDGLTGHSIGNGYVFVVGEDGETILGWSRTLLGPGPESGLWQVTGLPAAGEVTLVGFHPKFKQNMALAKVTLKGEYQRFNGLTTRYSTPAAAPSNLYADSDAPAGTGVAPAAAQVLVLAGWLIQQMSAVLERNAADHLAEDLLSNVEPADFRPAVGTTVVEEARPSAAARTPAAPTDAIDLIFCIDTTGSMRDDIDAVKRSASAIIDTIFSVTASPRLALVAYRDYGSTYVTKGYAFTTERSAISASINALDVGEGGDMPEAVYEGLLHAIGTKDLGGWRNGVRKIVVLMGDAPPHTRRHTLDEVARAAEEVDPAHVFPISIAGAGADTRRAFSAIAERTGGAMGSTATAADLPRELMKIVRLGARMADTPLVDGRVVNRMNEALEVELEDGLPVLPGMVALVFSRDTPSLVVAEGRVTTGEGTRWTVELSAMFGTETVSEGCRVRIVVRD